MPSGNRFVLLTITALVLIFSLSPHEPISAQDTTIRVHLLSANSVKISTDGDLLICDGDKALLTAKDGNTFSLKDDKFSIGESPSSLDCLTLRPARQDGIIYVNDKAYRGIVVLQKKDKNRFLVINHVNIEDYLAGVLGREVSASWPRESLKAQAVAARSYVLYKKKEPRDKDFDVYSTVMDQVYGGLQDESPQLLQIVRDTRGQVLTYKGDLVKAYYHSTCGGHTEDGLEVFPGDAAFMKGVPCPYCKGSPGLSWDKEFTDTDFNNALRKSNIISGDIMDIKVTRVDRSGRAAEISILSSEGEKKLRGSELRMAIGPGQLRSTRFKMKVLEREEEEVPTFTTRWAKRSPGGEIIPQTYYAGLFLTIFDSFPSSPTSQPGSLPLQQDARLEPAGTPPEVLSTRLETSMVKVATRFRFSGEGWGHGVGMCQWGAYGMASQGFDYAQILQFYYPETELSKIVETPSP